MCINDKINDQNIFRYCNMINNIQSYCTRVCIRNGKKRNS